MAIDIEQLWERIQTIDIRGITNMDHGMAGEEKQQPVVEIHFLRLQGALKEDPEQIFRLFVGADDPEESPNDLAFLVAKVDQCEAFAKVLTLYMDANGIPEFGAYKWVPEKSEIRFKYCLPLPEISDGYPDSALLQRIFVSIYEALLFPDTRIIKWSIDDDDMLDDEEKKAKKQRLDDLVASLLGPAGEQEEEGV